MDNEEILWKPDQNKVYVAEFEKMFPHPVVLIWPHVIRDECDVHFMYKLNRSHMHEGIILSSSDTDLVFRWDHGQGISETIRVHPMTEKEFYNFQQEWPVYKCPDDILRDYAAAY